VTRRFSHGIEQLPDTLESGRSGASAEASSTTSSEHDRTPGSRTSITEEGRGEAEAREKAEAEVEARGELEAPAGAEAPPNVQPAPAPAAPQGVPVSPGLPGTGTPLAPETAQPEQGPGGTRLVSDGTSPSSSTGRTSGTSFVSAVSDTSGTQGRELPFTGHQLPLAAVFGAGALAAGIALRRRTRGVAR
jgi:hypothetical protein